MCALLLYICITFLITTCDVIQGLHHLCDGHEWFNTRSSSPPSWQYSGVCSGSSPWCSCIMLHSVNLINLTTVNGPIVINLHYLLYNHVCCSTVSNKSVWRTYTMFCCIACSRWLLMILCCICAILLMTIGWCYTTCLDFKKTTYDATIQLQHFPVDHIGHCIILLVIHFNYPVFVSFSSLF